MLKLYLIGTILGKIIAVAGPLPYDMEECLFRASIRNADWHSQYDSSNPPVINGITIKLEDVEFNCVERSERPEMN